MNLNITWPIQDPHQSLQTMKNEALTDLKHTLRQHRLTPRARPVYSITHGAHPQIHVHLPVQEHPA